MHWSGQKKYLYRVKILNISCHAKFVGVMNFLKNEKVKELWMILQVHYVKSPWFQMLIIPFHQSLHFEC